jgi:hypothetical protein
MKWNANSRVFLLTAAVGLVPSTSRGQTVVADCVVPPGGRVTCEASQVAICKITQKTVDGSCKTPPRGLVGNDMTAWVLTEVTGKPVAPKEAYSERNAIILKTGQVKTADSVATFSLPKAITKELPFIR